MRLVLATSNIGKVKEIESFFSEWEIIPYTDLIKKFEIEENGKSFKENAILKAKAVWNKLQDFGLNEIVIADDSGISVEVLNWEPNIYSARYSGVNASSKDNLNKLINKLKELNVSSSKAFYTASIAIISKEGDISTTHGWMHGTVSPKEDGENGFGYDPIFTPDGETKTLGILSPKTKDKYSHRIKALKLAKIILDKTK
jgi:XTP/dITP diphosphohydrolase